MHDRESSRETHAPGPSSRRQASTTLLGSTQDGAHRTTVNVMELEASVALIAGGFALAGGFGGAALTAWFSRAAARSRTRTEDERRWLMERRHAYAGFLALAESMLREIDDVAVLLSYDGDEPASDDDEEMLGDGLLDYFAKWDEVLQPALGEVQLLASPTVAGLADRVSGALLEITGEVESRGAFTAYYPAWFQAPDLVQVLRNDMRRELGLEPMLPEAHEFPRVGGWPWLPDRPPRDSYVQVHPRV